MFAKLFTHLRFIYLNEYRKVTYRDQTKAVVLLFIYGLLIYKLYSLEGFVYKNEVFVACFLTQLYTIKSILTISILQAFHTRLERSLLTSIHLVIGSIPFLIWGFIEYKAWGFGGLFIIFIIALSPPIPSLQRGFPLNRLPLDPLTKTSLRQHPIYYTVLLMLYYILYEGLEVKNENLQFVVLGVLSYIPILTTNTNELFIYPFSARKSFTRYFFSQQLTTVVCYFILLLPAFIIMAFYKQFPIEAYLILAAIAAINQSVKYIFLTNIILRGICQSIILFFAISWLTSETMTWGYFVLACVAVYLSNRLAVKRCRPAFIQQHFLE